MPQISLWKWNEEFETPNSEVKFGEGRITEARLVFILMNIESYNCLEWLTDFLKDLHSHYQEFQVGQEQATAKCYQPFKN